MLYTKANRATNAFLSAAYPTASQENESESASVAGSIHSSCTSLVGSEASRHITGQSSDSSESECLSDPPAVKSTTFQSRRLCRTLSGDSCRRKVTSTSLRDCRPSSCGGKRNYNHPQLVLDRSFGPLSAVNISSSRSSIHSAGKFSWMIYYDSCTSTYYLILSFEMPIMASNPIFITIYMCFACGSNSMPS